MKLATKIANALGVSPDYLVGNTDVELENILDKVIAIQKQLEEDMSHMIYPLDGLIQHVKTKIVYK